MTERPTIPEAAFVGFAVLDELMKKLQEKHLITKDEIIQVLDSTAARLDNFQREEYQASSNFIRTVMIPAYISEKR